MGSTSFSVAVYSVFKELSTVTPRSFFYLEISNFKLIIVCLCIKLELCFPHVHDFAIIASKFHQLLYVPVTRYHKRLLHLFAVNLLLISLNNFVAFANLVISCSSPLSRFFMRMLKHSNIRAILPMVIPFCCEN